MTTPDKLCIIWSSQDPDVARNLILMYGGNALPKGWWDMVTIIVWGPSQKLLTSDLQLQQELADIMNGGVDVLACRSCAERYGLVEDLAALGLSLEYVGAFFTDVLKDSTWKTVTL